MNATPTSKAVEPQGALARADDQLAHVYEQLARADEELTRVSEQVAKMERGAAPPPSAGPGPQSPPARPALRALVGLPLAAGIIVAALVLQSSYGDEAKLVVARWAPQLVSTPSLPPENPPLPAQSAPSPDRSGRSHRSGRGGGRTPASNARGADHTAGGRAGSYRSTPRSYAVAGKVGARSREHGTQHRTAQGEPATNNQRQFKSHSGAQGEPGRDQTRAREGFRAEPVQDVIASDAADADLAQARAGVSVAARESATSTSQGVDLL